MNDKLFPDDEGGLQIAVFIQSMTNTDADGTTTHDDQVVLNLKEASQVGVGR